MSEYTLGTIQDFILTVGLHGKEKTMRDYERIVNKFYSYVEKEVTDISTQDVFNFIQYSKKVYKPKTAQIYLSVLKSYLSEYAPQVRAKRIRTMKAYADHPSDVFTPEEYVSMLSFIKADSEEGVRDNLLMRMLYDTGCRICEMQFVLSNPWLFTKERTLFIKTAKTSQMRLIAWSEDTDIFLRLWLSFEKDFVSIRQCQRIIKKYAVLARITKKITPHSYRHTKAHKILSLSGNIKDVAETLGHSNLLSSQHYLREVDQERIVRQQKWL